ncbi:MAG: DUF3530 family protein [Gammaproteobacteria bacterium]|nr:DUF3530 family protein [Gammaproteobacteria bacterium]
MQLPLLPHGANREDYAAGLDAAAERMRAAIVWLAEQGISRIVAVGHGYGADVALHATADNALPEVISIVAGNWRLAPERIDHAQPVPLPERPVFDLYGGRDRELRMAGERRATSWNHSNWYTSWELAAADFDFTGCEAQFAGRVRGWLARVDKLIPPS